MFKKICLLSLFFWVAGCVKPVGGDLLPSFRLINHSDAVVESFKTVCPVDQFVYEYNRAESGEGGGSRYSPIPPPFFPVTEGAQWWSKDLPVRAVNAPLTLSVQLSGSTNEELSGVFVTAKEGIWIEISPEYRLTAIVLKSKTVRTENHLKLSADQKRKQGELEAGFAAFKNIDNEKTEEMISVLSRMAGEGKVTLKSADGSQTLTDFTTSQDIIAFFNIEPYEGYLGDIFRQIHTEFSNDAAETEFETSLTPIKEKAEAALPPAPQNLLLSALKESATEDDRFIRPNGEAPLDKLNEGHREQLYFYSGIPVAASGKKGALSFPDCD